MWVFFGTFLFSLAVLHRMCLDNYLVSGVLDVEDESSVFGFVFMARLLEH